MPVGLPEIIILIAIILVVFGGRKLPELGRRTGSMLRRGGEEAKAFKDVVTSDDEPAASQGDESIGRSAGRGLREFREGLTGSDDGDSDEGELVEGKVVDPGRTPSE